MNQELDHLLALSLCPSLDWDRDKHNWVEGFKAGAGHLQGFGEFLRKHYEPWYTQWKEYKSGKTYTTEELIQKYLSDNKQKEDADKKATETNP